MRRLAIGVGFLLAILCAGSALAVDEGAPAPPFTLVDLLSEAEFSLEDHPGQVIVLNFWAYWCEFCELAAPAFQKELVEVYQPLGVVFLGIEKGQRRASFSGNIRDPSDFVRKMGWSFPNGIDRDEAVYSAYAATMDQYMVIGGDGTVLYVSPITGFEEGAINIPALVAAIELALDEPTSSRSSTWSRVKRLWDP